MVVTASSPYEQCALPVAGRAESVDTVEEAGEESDPTQEEMGWGEPEDWDLDDPNIYPLQPGADTPPRAFYERFVDYSDRSPRDVVISGPVLAGWGPGRYFQSRRRAYDWCVNKYGGDRVARTRYTKGRWSFLIKNLLAQGENDA